MAESCEESAAARVQAADIRSALEIFTAFPSPRGGELSLAVGLAEWAQVRWPMLTWEVERLGERGASLVSRAPGDADDRTLIYSHLDTSLTGGVGWDSALTARLDPPMPWRWDAVADATWGFGLGVAKAPAAAALVGYAAAAAQRADEPGGAGLALLLAGSGTHRSPFQDSPTGQRLAPTGVESYLASRRRPDEVVVAKGGPPGLLHEEPGAMFVKVRVGAEMLPAMSGAAAVPSGGLPLRLGPVLDAIGTWREAHLASRPPVGQIAAEVGVGSIVAGQPGKPDLLPAAVDIHAYVVMVDGDDAQRIGAELVRHLQDRLAGTALAQCPVEVTVALEHPSAATPAAADVVQRAASAWLAERGSPPAAVTGWKGSTDGVVFRSAGCQTVRVGPSPKATPEDVRVDRIAISDLVSFARMYARLGANHAQSS